MSELAQVKAELDRWLFDHALPLWWEVGADRERGGFFESIGLNGRPTEADRRTRVQARQTYTYAEGGRLGWTGPWREAMNHGLDYLFARYRRPDGLFRTKVRADGATADDNAVLYDQDFLLFAMASVYRAAPERTDLPSEARSLLQALLAYFDDGGPGLKERDARPYQSNAHMHLFEASLAWAELDEDPMWPATADRVAELALSRFIDRETGGLREVFDRDWNPAPGPDGRIVEPGHQFEWAWLMQRWGKLRGREDACRAAKRLFEIGSGPGVDRTRGVAFFSMTDDFTPLESMARLWAQTEWAKAAAILYEDAGGDDRAKLEAEIVAAAKGLMLYFDTPTQGAWRDRLLADGTWVDEPSPASSFYHIICAISELHART
jgi:mannose/cellobiose epimerase-like protein (N-acyl-D-glucosamine 2-epimerase family)